MNIIPAIDIKNGECVRLTQGKSDSVTTYNQDPIKQAKIFELNGCERIHIVDLDAAITNNKKNNINAINNIKKNTSLKIQLGGGIRSYEQANYWISSGIEYLIIGSMAMENPTETIKIIEGFENKIFIGVDEKDNQLMIKGWTEKTNLTIKHIIKQYEEKNISGFIYTDINRDGTLLGLNENKIKNFCTKTKKKVIIGGGLANINDIIKMNSLNLKNIKGIIIGKAYYSGSIEIKDALEIVKNVKE